VECKGILRVRDQVCEIRKVEGVHTCATKLITEDHRHLSSRIISQHERQMVESDPHTNCNNNFLHSDLYEV